MQDLAPLITDIRDRFAHVDTCPFTGPRIFFENAGGALTLKSVVAASEKFAAIPDNQGRDNAASQALMAIIDQGKADARLLLNAPDGEIFVGESGTELCFRTIRAACRGAGSGRVLGATIEHPATGSAARLWAQETGRDYTAVIHDNDTGTVSADAYAQAVTADTAVATILHTSPVSGMGMDVAAIVAAIRAVSPDCLIIVDGIQHAAHGGIDIAAYDIDAYVVSPYKVYSRHGYGLAWVSDRLARLPHDNLIGAELTRWELGTRDTGAYATFSEVVRYFEWLGGAVGETGDARARIKAAGRAMQAQEKTLTDAMLHGTGNLAGLADMDKVHVIGGIDNPTREGLVSLTVDGLTSGQVVAGLADHGIRTHQRKDDHYSGPVLIPLGLDSCVRVSLCHYNSLEEVSQFLAAMRDIVG